MKKKIYNISIISNSTVFPIRSVLDEKFKKKKISYKIKLGTYDNIIEDVKIHKNSDAIIIFWDLFNVMENFHTKILNFSKSQIEVLNNKIKNDIKTVIKITANCPNVIFNNFTLKPFGQNTESNLIYKKFADNLNIFLKGNVKKNTTLFDIEDLFYKYGAQNLVDFQKFYFFKSLYNLNFYKKYVEKVYPFLVEDFGYSKKVLILDCDNTLWDGIIGENDNKKMFDLENYKSRIFFDIQTLIKNLKKSGVILALNTKNNFKDLKNFFNLKKNIMPLKFSDFAIIKSNWNNKTKNIFEISKELNISTNSMIFLDDSPYELDLVKKKFPDILTRQVPKNLTDYPGLIFDLSKLFFKKIKTKEDLRKTEYFQEENKRKRMKKFYISDDDYLKSLKIKMKISTGKNINLDRAHQMCQKINQFNFTTKRYVKTELRKLNEKKNKILTFELKDKFGEYGTTGMAIYKIKNNKLAILDSFLMSCRIIGRKAEFTFLNYIIKELKSKGIEKLKINFEKNEKNLPAQNFLNNLKVKRRQNKGQKFIFEVQTNKFKFNKCNINILNGTK